MAMDVEPFYYLRVEDVVPEDAVYVVIGGLITEVPEDVFEYHENLARVEFQEGVEEIGRRAFAGCRNLTRVGGASSLRLIGDGAFECCERLSEVLLREGLQRIERQVFYACALRRITVPSSVEEIGTAAFRYCERLSEVVLREGLQLIGTKAFYGCALRRITVPSSVVEIGDNAFHSCNNLEAVILAGGMVFVEWGAFEHCPRLERIAIPSMAIVVEEGEDENGRTTIVTGGMERVPANESSEPPQLILASPHLVTMSPEDLTNLKEAINQIVDATQEACPLDLSVGDVSGQIRNCFIDRTAMWYERYKNEVAATLELGLWKIELGRVRGVGQNCAVGGGKRAWMDVLTRDDSRRTCGADPIVGLVLSALAGPHHRADQGEDEGLIQP